MLVCDCSARAIQSIIQLTGEDNLYDMYWDDVKTIRMDWNRETAAEVIQTWQRAFVDVSTQLSLS